MSRDSNFKDVLFEKSEPDSWKNRPQRPGRDEPERRRMRSGSNDEDPRYKGNYRGQYGARKDYFYDGKGKRSDQAKFVREKHDRREAPDRGHPGPKFSDGRRNRPRRRMTSSSSSSSSRSRSSSPKRSRRGRSYSSSSSVSYSNESPQIVSVKKVTPSGAIDCNVGPWQGGQQFSHCGYPPKNPPGSNGRQFGSDQIQYPGGLTQNVNSQFVSMPPRGFPEPPALQNQFIPPVSQPPVEGSYPGYQGEENYPGPGFSSYQGYDPQANPSLPQGSFFQQQVPALFSQAQQQSSVNYNVSGNNWVDPNSANHSNLIYPGADPVQPPKIQSQAADEELLQQKRTLIKQREEYIKKNSSLQRELTRLKDQRKELLQENNKDTERFLRENSKFQSEIGQRLKAIENVIEMLSGLIGDYQELDKKGAETPPSDKRRNQSGDGSERGRKMKWNEEKRRESSSSSPEVISDRGSISPPVTLPRTADRTQQPPPASNILHYDPELHWCSLCNLFPKTFQDYLNHLHTPEHKAQIVSLKLDESPWHADIVQEPAPPFNKHAQAKRVPLRGVQFLVPCTGWYCRLCKSWIGDLHCASEHLKGSKHTGNYSDYISQNPHWEVDWLSDRTRSYEKCSVQSRLRDVVPSDLAAQEDSLASEKAKINALSNTLLAVLAQQNKNKAKNKRSSSSSSESSSENSPKKSKKSKKKKSKKKKKKDNSPDSVVEKQVQPEKSDDLISEWMENEDKRDEITLDLKGRMKQKTSFAPRRPFKGDKFSDDEKQQKDDNSKGSRYGEYRDPRRRDPKEGRNPRDARFSREQRESPRDNRRRDENERRKDEQEYKYRDERRRSPARNIEKSDRGPNAQMNDRNKDPKAKVEKPQGKLWFPNNKVEEEETSFEKQAAESAAKKKAETRKPTQFTLPKAKLPFIGRMPILKKKPVDSKVEETFKEAEKDDEKEKTLTWPEIPIAEVSTEVKAPEVKEGDKKVLPKSTLIISKRPRLAEPEEKDATKAIVITADMKKKTEDNLAEQDMDIECDEAPDPVIWEANEDNTDNKEELHKDFKDALDLLFPEEGSKPKEKKEDNLGAIDSEGGFSAQEVHGNWIPSNTTSYPYTDGNYPPGYTNPTSTYYGPAYDGSYSNYYQGPTGQAGYQQPQSTSGAPFVPPPTHIPPPNVPPPPPIISSRAPSEGVEAEEEQSAKRKNPPSQRMRRHLQKKRSEGKEASPTPPVVEGPKKKYEGMDVSDLAMLGIDEDDSIAQQF